MTVNKNRSTDIILKLKPIDGAPRSTQGIVDRSLFTGGNNLHAVMDIQTCLWHLKYDLGGLPPKLRGMQFTSLPLLLKYVKTYMKTRNVDIVEIID